MKTRKLFFASLLLVFMGLFAQFTAFSYAAKAVDQVNAAMKTPSDSNISRAKLAPLHRKANAAVHVGVTCAIIGALLTFLSYRAEEPAPQSIIVVLLLFYVVLFFGVV